MKILGYLIKNLLNTLLLFREGYRVRDKILLFPYGLFQAVVMMLGVRRFVPSIRERVNRINLPFDLMLKEQYGLFYCRGGSTADLSMLCRTHEPEVTEYLKKTEGVFIDIGSCVGRYTIMVGRQIGIRGKVLSIEPEPRNFAALQRNIQLNHLNNVCALNVACWSSNEELKLFLAPCNSGGHSNIEPFEQHIMVKGLRLDDILRDLGWSDVNVIKIDVEGATAQVLAGAEETLSSNDQLQIIFEHYNEQAFEKCRRILEGHGYIIRPMAPIFNSNFLATKRG